jgi:hypothetical protein
MNCPFRADLISSSRGYHMHQRMGRVSESARQPYDIGAASSANTIFDVQSFDLSTSDLLAL